MIKFFKRSPILDQNRKIYYENLHQPKLKAFQCQFLTGIKHAKKYLSKTVKKLLIRSLPQLACFMFAPHAWKRLGGYEKY